VGLRAEDDVAARIGEKQRSSGQQWRFAGNLTGTQIVVRERGQPVMDSRNEKHDSEENDEGYLAAVMVFAGMPWFHWKSSPKCSLEP
jgi:hypothetical protein